ncbi:MAG TPA: DUF3828 domain-containing protein [Stellaceae bacterium]|jgi:hypothetical protein|nr:DUF3828 domain-containing protein [Stellaceae bacterium]
MIADAITEQHIMIERRQRPGRRSALRNLALALAIAWAGLAAFGPTGRAAEATPDKFLATIYHHYEGKNAKGVDIFGKAALQRYFEPSLVAIIAADEQAAAKRGDEPELDGDPFIDAQDWEITQLKIATRMDGADKAMATVSFKNFDEPHAVTVKLVRLPAGWRIADIVWPEGSLRGLYTENH